MFIQIPIINEEGEIFQTLISINYISLIVENKDNCDIYLKNNQKLTTNLTYVNIRKKIINGDDFFNEYTTDKKKI